jgi:hypothetical protein
LYVLYALPLKNRLGSLIIDPIKICDRGMPAQLVAGTFHFHQDKDCKAVSTHFRGHAKVNTRCLSPSLEVTINE